MESPDQDEARATGPQTGSHIGRRNRSRLRTMLPATITTINGLYRALLQDISLTGARVHITDRRGIVESLLPGQDAVLEWADFEAFGTLIWVEGEACGLSFEEIVRPEILIQTRDLEDRYAAAGRSASDLRRTTKAWVEGHQ